MITPIELCMLIGIPIGVVCMHRYLYAYLTNNMNDKIANIGLGILVLMAIGLTIVVLIKTFGGGDEYPEWCMHSDASRTEICKSYEQ